MKKAIGIDIGGTKISAGIVNGEDIEHIISKKTPKNAKIIKENIFEIIKELLKIDKEIKFVGIASAGTVDIDNSKVTGSTGNLAKGYSDIEFKKEIESKFGLKTLIENDANSAAYAEYKVGAAKGQKNTIAVTLGTGVGGGIIINGKLLRGKSGAGAEIGHIPISEHPQRRCTCGGWDCWEAYASGTGYAINAREYAAKLPKNERGFLKNLKIEEITSYDVLEGKNKNDEVCMNIHEKWENLVSKGLIALANIFDPESIVLSGGMAGFVNITTMEELINSQTTNSQIELKYAKMENQAGMLGAGLLAIDKFS